MPRKTGTGKFPKSLTFSVDEKTFNALNEKALNLGVPASELLREALTLYMGKMGKSK